MFRVMESNENHGDDTSGEVPITIQVNSGGNSVHDDTSSYHTGSFRNQFNAPLSMAPIQSIFARGRSNW